MSELVPAWPPIASRSIDERAQALRGGIDRGGETARAGADDREIARRARRARGSPSASASSALVGSWSTRPSNVSTAGKRGSIDAELLDELAAGLGLRVVEPVRDAVAFEEIAQLVAARRGILADHAHELEPRRVAARPFREELADDRIEVDLG